MRPGIEKFFDILEEVKIRRANNNRDVVGTYIGSLNKQKMSHGASQQTEM